jgi:hypothetical protein
MLLVIATRGGAGATPVRDESTLADGVDGITHRPTGAE